MSNLNKEFIKTSSLENDITPIPTKWVGPLKIIGTEFDFATKIPLATLERPLWPSVNRGARLTELCGGVKVNIIKDGMTRSVLLENQSKDAAYLVNIVNLLPQYRGELEHEIANTGGFVHLQDWHAQIIGNLLFLRFNFSTGEAAGHNMVTKAADKAIDWLLKKYAGLRYVSISGNLCVDKKVSSINSILGRGKYVVAEMVVPKDVCLKHLRAVPASIVNLNIKKNLLGSIAAGSIHTANAHFANMLLAFYLATGQDAANIVEGSQGIVQAELCNDGDLYFAVTLPSIIVGAVGSGKDLEFARSNLEKLGCLVVGGSADRVNNNDAAAPSKANASKARRLAAIAAAGVWCGEISLLAAQVNRGELVRGHIALERR